MKRRGLIALILAGALAAFIYYGAVWLVVERVKTMPDSPPLLETPDREEKEELR